MTRTPSRFLQRSAPLLACAALCLVACLPALAEEPDPRYVTTRIRGTLTFPESGQPLVGARIRFTPTTAGTETVEALTDETGSFVAEGLGFGLYAVEIITADGETIRGVNELPISPDRPIEVMMSLSDRIRSSTSLVNQPERFLAVVERKPTNWGRFWKEFAIYVGIAAASGAAVF